MFPVAAPMINLVTELELGFKLYSGGDSRLTIKPAWFVSRKPQRWDLILIKCPKDGTKTVSHFCIGRA